MDIIINNKYNLINNDYNNFIVNIFYLESNLCKIIILNKNNSFNWDDDLKIELDSSEILSVGSSNNYYKIIELYTDTLLLKKKNINSFIIVENDEINEQNYLLKYVNIINGNHNLNYLFFNNYNKREFIKKECDKYLDIYDSIIDINFKNIIFIFNYIYLYGGFYCTNNITLEDSIEKIYDINNNVYFINNNNIIELLFSNINNINLIKYIDNILYKNGTFEDIISIFENNHKYIQFNCENINKYLNINTKKYNTIININKITFMINSNKKYEIEYLNLNYYSIKIIDDKFIESNLEIKYKKGKTGSISQINYNDENKNIYIFKVI
jgi:hypothetical protein